MKNKVLAATYNPVTKSKIFTVMVDVPYCLLPELLQHKELDIIYKKIEDITLQEVLDNPYTPIWNIQDKDITEEDLDYQYQCTINSITSNYTNLLDLQVNKQTANQILIPVAYTTGIISGTEWDNFFELRCPRYVIEDSVNGSSAYKSKKDCVNWFGEDMLEAYSTDLDWQEINKSSAQPELQVIAEMLYDLYQEVEWKATEYHIPFEEDINKQFTIEELNDYWRTENGYFSTNSVDSYYYVGGASITEEAHINYCIQISTSMCSNFSTEGTLEYHLNNK